MTTLTSLNFSPNPNITNNGMFTPQLTQAEINAIPVDTSKIGGIIYNIDTQELQYLAPTLQWVNVSSDGGEPTFTDLTVTNDATIANLHVTNGIIAGGDISGVNLKASGNSFTAGIVYGKRAGGGVYNVNTGSFAVTANTLTKINVTTTASYSSGFTASNNKLQFNPVPTVPALTVQVVGYFSFQFSANNALISLGVGINGSPQLQTSYLSATTAGTYYSLWYSGAHNLSSTSNVGDYIELWVMAGVDGTFSAGGAMNFMVTQVA